ncbi:MurNAc alpha-1-phosphate uridylyltransferase [Yoonia maricola]|uniref:MurNAc alpha-1-phosphate uridylyltransferase n=1 Tax=Yoonia maricola TaxID=420999 RepID=A0A2M8W4Q6_9RHOB|nr:nucleotidyltransferase family protein [Yoonia maricola]PJI85888.1 MurNAc alpha-1-phosphate uridylyltransferase [Yoonia maricola]
MSMPILFFAAGLGTRMGALTADKPKPLIKVAGKALIDHALDLAKDTDISKKVVNLHYHGDMIRDHLAGQPIIFSDESDMLLETGGGLRKALPLLNGNPVLTMNTDAVWNGPNPIRHILQAWRPEMEALLLLVEKRNVSGHLGKGDFHIDANGQLHRAPEAIYTGLQILRTDVLSEIAETAFSLNIAWNIIGARGGLYGTVYDGQWCDVGQPSSIEAAEAMLDV